VLDRSQISQRSSVELNHMEWETVAPFLLTRGDRCDARNVHEGRDELSREPGLPELFRRDASQACSSRSLGDAGRVVRHVAWMGVSGRGPRQC
jgi:hypothetical protein